LDPTSRLVSHIQEKSARILCSQIGQPSFESIIGVPCFGNKPSTIESVSSLLRTADSNVLLIVSLESYSDSAASGFSESLVNLVRQSDRGFNFLVVHHTREMKLVNHWNFLIECALMVDGCKYFAWGSDHDFWHPHWYKCNQEVFSREPVCLLAVPPMAIAHQGKATHAIKVKSSRGKNKESIESALGPYGPGNSVYGLYSIAVFKLGLRLHQVLLPDRLLLTLIALWHPVCYASFENRPMWIRSELQSRTKVLSKQRNSVLYGRLQKLISFLPWTVVHTVIGLRYVPRISRENRIPIRFLIFRLVAFEVRSEIAHRRKQIRAFRRNFRFLK
jgi:hypothetical protein